MKATDQPQIGLDEAENGVVDLSHDEELRGLLEEWAVTKAERRIASGNHKDNQIALKTRFPESEWLGKAVRCGEYLISFALSEVRDVAFTTEPRYRIKVKAPK